MSEAPHITVCDGKYTLVFDPTNMRALRYGEPWRDLIGDGLVMALGQEILDLKEALRRILEATPESTNSASIREFQSWINAVAGTALRTHERRAS